MQNNTNESNTLNIKTEEIKQNWLSYLYENHFKKILFFVIFIISLIIIYIIKNNKEIITYTVIKSDIYEYTTITGNIKPKQESALSFEKSGKIQKISVNTGDKVNKGQILASISADNDMASILSARSSVAQAEANLADIQNGATKIDVSLKEDILRSSLENLNNNNIAVIDTTNTIYSSIFDIINNKLSSIFTYDSTSYILSKNACNQNLSVTIENKRLELDKIMKDFANFKDTIKLSEDIEANQKSINTLNDKAILAIKNTNTIIDNLNELYSSNCAVSNKNLDTERLIISNNKKTVDGLLEIVNSNKSKTISYRNAYQNALLSLEQVKTGATPEKIKSVKAQVENARGMLAQAEANYEKNFIKAPFSGTITAVDINLGEISSSGKTAIKIITDGEFEIKAKLTETDVTKVKIGQEAEITLDAYGNANKYKGNILFVDPSSTKEGNNEYYYARIGIINTDNNIKGGMNAEAKIITDSKKQSLVLDNKYLLAQDGKSFVNILQNKSNKKIKIEDCNMTPIQTGITSKDGKIEIIDGLKEGDILCPITPIIQK